jgi:hypothetical protein
VGPKAEDVVPGAHFHAGVDGDRPHRRMRKHEAHGERQIELRHDRLEVVAIRTQAVEPDDGQLRRLAGGDFYRWQERGDRTRHDRFAPIAYLRI